MNQLSKKQKRQFLQNLFLKDIC